MKKKAAKLIAISFVMLSVLACTKSTSTDEEESRRLKLEKEKLEAMRVNIIKDWKLIKIMTVKPVAMWGSLATSYCSEAGTYSFRPDNRFVYSDNRVCSLRDSVRGRWELRRTDSLYLHPTENYNFFGGLGETEVSMLTADTMKLNLLVSDGTQVITSEYTFIPK